MKETTTKTIYKCDLCHKECKPIRSLSLPYNYSMDLVNHIIIEVRASVPYANDKSEDVCEECLRKVLEKYLESLRKKLKRQKKEL